MYEAICMMFAKKVGDGNCLRMMLHVGGPKPKLLAESVEQVRPSQCCQRPVQMERALRMRTGRDGEAGDGARLHGANRRGHHYTCWVR